MFNCQRDGRCCVPLYFQCLDIVLIQLKTTAFDGVKLNYFGLNRELKKNKKMSEPACVRLEYVFKNLIEICGSRPNDLKFNDLDVFLHITG